MAAIQPRTGMQKVHGWNSHLMSGRPTTATRASKPLERLSKLSTMSPNRVGIGILKSFSQSVRDPAQLQWLVQAEELHRAQMPTVSKAAPRHV